MYEEHRKTDSKTDVLSPGSKYTSRLTLLPGLACLSKACCSDYLKFALYCAMLMIPLYAIIVSALKHNWIMVIIDALLIPVGFVHGLLLLSGLIS
jgi:energy-converting hydrogenase Eha subunit H